MPALRSVGATRSATFISALLVSTAFTAPAFAQIETVVVTAERKAEDIQTVPIAVTALTGTDLKAKQVYSFRDLQFHVPSVTYTKSNFGGAQFQIRGITTQFGLGAAIAQNENDIYLEAPQLVTGQYFDVDRVEVARGPQSTSYGRAATGGAVNIITTKPNLDDFQARASFDYGSYNTMKPEVMVNIPLIDGELGVRFAALGVFHDGYEKNFYSGPAIYPGNLDKRINGQGTASGRFSVRWQPSSDTTIDLVAEGGYENDNRVRGDKQLCHRDPSGVIGCLPDALGTQPLNVLSTLGATLGSKQGITALLNLSFTFPYAVAQTLGNTLGLFNLAGNGGPGDPGSAITAATIRGFSITPNPFTTTIAPGVYSVNPALVNGVGSGAGGTVHPDLLSADTAYSPKYKTSNQTYMLNWSQTLTSWLKATLDAGYATSYQFTQQNYNDASPENISPLISAGVAGFHTLFDAGANVSGAYNTYFSVPGALPISNTYYNGKFGSYAGSIDPAHGILTRNSYFSAYDEDQFSQREWTGELRFQTAFDGRFQMSGGLFWMSYDSRNQYWVAANGLDWESMVIGASFGTFIAPLPPPIGLGTSGLPLMLASTSYDGEYRRGAVQSRSAFLEGTYDLIPDTLKLIAGARFNDDRSSAQVTPVAVGGLLLANGFAPVGTPSCTANGGIAAPGCIGFPGTFRLPTGITGKLNNTTDKWTGRLSLNWTPKLSWTDQTFVYATLSRGELAGGVNKAQGTAALVVPTTYQPATVDAVEVGAKNTLLDGTLQANLTAWYYNYENYQVGIISNRAALTLNVPAHLYGLEGEFVWQPDEDLAFNATLSLTRSQAGNAYFTDQRNPTNNVPNSILIKDMTNGSLCVIQPITAAAAGHTPGESNAAFHVNNFYLPNGGNAAIDAPYGIPLVNYGICNAALQPLLNAFGFGYTQETNPRTGAPIAGVFNGTGFARNIHGNKLPQVPNAQVGVGGQYTYHWDDYTIVPRVDYYWQSSMQARIMNDPGSDYIGAWDTMNAQIQLNAPDSKWYAKVFVTNVFDKHNPTGVYLTDPTSALFTNVFAEDPRVVGVSIGATW
ncbi:MAG: TonB-dependent receptor plug domain-containing protein [Alphaproteobacteria bacterium]|nr:TonB-dependent receptor plug domain-containing protein [Alphaproteobacteria bacterium]MBL7100239.1 TonB-dependent receptor plug domain-containing protein [Alphaproteobacteria bacterium]